MTSAADPVRQLGPRVQVADPPLRLVPHPLPVPADVLGQAGGPRPLPQPGLRRTGEHRRAARPLRRDLDEGLVDERGDRVEVGGVRLQPEALRLQRDGPAAGERVEDRRRVAAGRAEDLLVGLAEQHLVGGVLPHDHPLDEPEQPLPLLRLRLLGGELPRPGRRVVDQLGEQHGPARGERSACPPQVQGRRVAVADRLLAGGRAVDRLQRQRHLDELPPARRRRRLSRHGGTAFRSSTGVLSTAASSGAEWTGMSH